MPRSPNFRRVDVTFSPAEYALVHRAATHRGQNRTAWVRTAAIRASVREDAVVRLNANRMPTRTAAVVRVLAQCGILLDRLAQASPQTTVSEITASMQVSVDDLISAIKALGDASL